MTISKEVRVQNRDTSLSCKTAPQAVRKCGLSGSLALFTILEVPPLLSPVAHFSDGYKKRQSLSLILAYKVFCSW